MARAGPDLLSQEWYAQPDDLIGGWCVTNVNKRPSQCNPEYGEGEVANFMNEAEARHVAVLHNASLIGRKKKWLLRGRKAGANWSVAIFVGNTNVARYPAGTISLTPQAFDALKGVFAPANAEIEMRDLTNG